MAGILNRIRSAFGRQGDAQGNTAESELVHQHQAAELQAEHDALDAVVLRYLLKLTPKAFAHYALAPNVPESLARCAAVGAVHEGTLSEKLAYALNKSDLQSRLRELGLPVTGTKDALIAMIIEADSVWAQSKGRDVRLYYLTEEGRQIAEELTLQASMVKSDAIKRCCELVSSQKYDAAAEVANDYRRQHELIDGRGQSLALVDNRRPLDVAEEALAADPEILSSFSTADAMTLRNAFVVSCLWGAGGWIHGFLPEALNRDLSESRQREIGAALIASAIKVSTMKKHKRLGVW